jgi:PKD-like domain/Secretion system C-terminal sorting domain
MNKIKIILFSLQLIIFNFQLTTSFAQVISNNGAVLSVSTGTTLSKMGEVVNTSGSIENAGTLIITSDVTNNATISGNGTYEVAGNFTNNSVFTAGTSTVSFNGSSLQTINGSTTTTFKNVDINNINGVTLGTNANVSGVFNFTSGVLNTGANKLSVTSTGSITGAGTSKFVNGFLEKYVPAGSTVPVNFELGFGATDYLPLNLSFASVTGAGTFVGKVNNGDHGNISTSCIDPTKSVNRNWALTNSGTAFTNYSATSNFIGVPTDADAGSNTANYKMKIFKTGAWTTLTSGVLTATSTQGTGITTDGDIEMGELLIVGAPVFTFGAAAPERCKAAGTETYTATATNAVSITYSIDAASISGGNSINSSTGVVTYNVNYIGTTTITATAYGCDGPLTTTTLTALTTYLPVNSAVISGSGCVAVGSTQTYSVSPVFRATLYTWTVPVGATITSGQGTNIITVTYDAALANGVIKVTPSNICGSAVASSQKDVSNSANGIPAKPATVFGPMVACSYIGVGVATYSVSPVINASSYTWNKPTGATITSGQGTNIITVTYTTAYSTGQFSVLATNGCGTSSFTYFTVSKTPTVPASVTGWANVYGVNDNATLVNYTTPVVEGAGSYNWTVPANVTIVSGQGTPSVNLTFAPAFTTGSIGVGVVTACGNSTIKTKAIVNNTTTPKSLSIVSATDSVTNSIVPLTSKVYPVPAIDQFTIEYNSNNVSSFISIISVDGKTVFKSNSVEGISDQQKLTVDCSAWLRGMYYLIIKDKNGMTLLTKSIVLID